MEEGKKSVFKEEVVEAKEDEEETLLGDEVEVVGLESSTQRHLSHP